METGDHVAVKSVVVTISRHKINDDGTVREAQETVDIVSVSGKPEYCVINPKTGDPLIINGCDLVEAVKHVCGGEK